MLSITPIYGGVLALLFVYLSYATIKIRLNHKISVGTGDDKTMIKAMRVHANFAEYTPLALLLMIMAELQGAPFWAMHLLGVLLVAGRFMHAYGFGRTPQVVLMRRGGMALTFTMILLAAVANIGHGLY